MKTICFIRNSLAFKKDIPLIMQDQHADQIHEMFDKDIYTLGV